MTGASPPPSRPQAIAFIIALVLIAGLVNLPLLVINVHDMADDALISARYAKNLADGHGLVYNLAPADERPVEGYSNFLWVMGLAAGFKLQQGPRLVTAVMGGASSLLAVIVVGLWVRRRTGSAWPALAAALLLGSSLYHAVWAVQGLETAMFAAWAVAAAAVMVPGRARPYEYLLALLAALTRPDGLIVLAAVLGAQFIGPGRRRALACAGLFFALPYAVYCGWKLAHFGAVVPNPFYAKTGLGLAGVRVGLEYAGRWAAHQPALAVLGLAAVHAGLRWREDEGLLAAALTALMYLGFVVAVGGDFMPDGRLMMHVAPLLVGGGMIALTRAGGTRLGRRPLWLIVLLLGMTVNLVQSQRYFYRAGPLPGREWHQHQAQWYGRTAAWLARHAGVDATVACGDIGYIGYVSGVRRILDTNGLVDAYLAHRPGAAALASDPEYVLAQRPDYLVLMVHDFGAGAIVGHSAFDRAVLAEPRYLAPYNLLLDLPGWRARERSFADGRTRDSSIRLRLYRRS
jgi:arabinofuranosyltransferase